MAFRSGVLTVALTISLHLSLLHTVLKRSIPQDLMSNSQSWVPVPTGSHFSLANIPFGIISTPTYPDPRPAIAIGDHVLNLETFAKYKGFSALAVIQTHLDVFKQKDLNAFAKLGRNIHHEVRRYLHAILTRDGPFSGLLQTHAPLRAASLFPRNEVTMHLPMTIGDYTDFYAGLNHAFNVGVLFRGVDNALQPNYRHLPVGYHGRASSVVVSGTPLRRPWGQILDSPAATPKVPIFTPCRRLDYELELGAFVCKSNELGSQVSTAEARDENIFGFVLMNDWSARDVQAWEYVPLGPFNSKNFGTAISPWVVLADTLEQFKGNGLSNAETELASYLKEDGESAYDIKLEVKLTTPNSTTATLTRTTALNLLWSFPQMLAHHTVTGCPMRVGDLLGSGTISGTNPGEQGSLLEQNKNGKARISLMGDNGTEEERIWVEDGDTVTMSGFCGQGDDLVGFGECVTLIKPALERN